MVEAKSSSKEVISNNNFFHPLDPLSFDEINKTTKIVKNNANLGKELLFETIMLIEPPKEEVLAFKIGDQIIRKALVVVLNFKEEKIYELDINLNYEKIER